MRTALALVAAAVVVFLLGWIVDDKVFGDDVPRNRSVAGVSIGGLSLEDAEAKLAEAGLADRGMALTFGGEELFTSAGVVVVVRIVKCIVRWGS